MILNFTAALQYEFIRIEAYLNKTFHVRLCLTLWNLWRYKGHCRSRNNQKWNQTGWEPEQGRQSKLLFEPLSLLLYIIAWGKEMEIVWFWRNLRCLPMNWPLDEVVCSMNVPTPFIGCHALKATQNFSSFIIIEPWTEMGNYFYASHTSVLQVFPVCV